MTKKSENKATITDVMRILAEEHAASKGRSKPPPRRRWSDVRGDDENLGIPRDLVEGLSSFDPEM